MRLEACRLQLAVEGVLTPEENAQCYRRIEAWVRARVPVPAPPPPAQDPPGAPAADARVTLSGRPAEPNAEGTGAPAPIDPATGMHRDYWILSEEERAKGFVRPVRRSYRHVGIRPKHPLRDLTPEESRYTIRGYVKFETYHPATDGSSVTGRYWTEAQLNSGCGVVTTMAVALAETYARDPKFYGATFCCGCGTHLPVGEMGEFVWEPDGVRVGT
jgi:hypothetical protein